MRSKVCADILGFHCWQGTANFLVDAPGSGLAYYKDIDGAITALYLEGHKHVARELNRLKKETDR